MGRIRTHREARLGALTSDRAGGRRTERLRQVAPAAGDQPRAETAKPRAEMSDASFLQLAESPEPETRTENEKPMARSSRPRPRRFAHPKKFAKAARGPRPTDRSAAYSEFARQNSSRAKRSEAVVTPKGWNWPCMGDVDLRACPARTHDARIRLGFCAESQTHAAPTSTPAPLHLSSPPSALQRPSPRIYVHPGCIRVPQQGSKA